MSFQYWHLVPKPSGIVESPFQNLCYADSWKLVYIGVSFTVFLVIPVLHIFVTFYDKIMQRLCKCAMTEAIYQLRSSTYLFFFSLA